MKSAGNSVDAADVARSVSFAITTAPVASLALAANRVAPQPPGTTITWTAAPTGGGAPYQYKWFVFNGTSWTVAADWTTASSFAWTPLTANANYSVRAWVRSAGNTADAAEAAATTPFAINTVTSSTVTGVTLVPDRASPQTAGTPVIWTATPAGGIGPHQYKWWIFDGVAWAVQGTWTATNTFAWTPAAGGNYLVGVWVKSAGNSVDAADVARSVPYTIGGTTVPRISMVSLSADRSSPQAPGTTITWTATPTGGSAPYQYKWSVYDGAWSDVTGWTSQSTLAWTPVLANAGYQVRIWARSAGNVVDAPEASNQVAFSIGAPSLRVSAVTLTPNRTSVQPAGTTITWTATPVGGAAPHQYKWWIYDGVAWTVATGWTTNNTFAWTPAVAGSYYVGVWVKSAGNLADAAEVPVSVAFVIR